MNLDFTAKPQYTADQAFWSSVEYFDGDDLAASTFVNKYALKDQNLKTSFDSEGNEETLANYAELTPDNMHDRLAREIAKKDVEFKYEVIILQDEAICADYWDYFVERFSVYREAFNRFKYIVPQGSPMYGIGNHFAKVSISNCVVVESPPDNISGIFESCKDLANLFKRRCGVGVALDTLRPQFAPVSNSAGTSTGSWSFSKIYSETCRIIGQNGRRGALMLTMDVRHPDIANFVVMKRDLTQVTGANVSVMLTDDFMNAVENNEEWICRWPIEDDYEAFMAKGGHWVDVIAKRAGDVIIDPLHPLDHKRWVSDDPKEKRVVKSYKASELWYLINESATMCAEPGLLFWDNYGRMLPANKYAQFKLICVNPCSEIGLSAYDSCRLTSLNLFGFVLNPFTKQARFDWAKFKEMVRLGMRIMDDIVDIEIDYLTTIIDHVDEPEEKVLWTKLRQAAIDGRRTGLGTHALADCLLSLGLRYDSDSALDLIKDIFRTFGHTAYDESVELAIERGAFPAFDWETEKDCEFFAHFPPELLAKMAKHGRRNISLLTMAPTGSVSIVSQTSSGIEPIFGLFYMRRKKINPSDPDARIDFVDQNGDRWAEYMVIHPALKSYMQQEIPEDWAAWEKVTETVDKKEWYGELNKILAEKLGDHFVTAGQINPYRRVEIQGAIQKYIDHGISSTLNLPMGTTVEQVQDIYVAAWKHGLKGVTVYVDGSRSGVLVNMNKKPTATEEIVDALVPKRPEVLECDIHRSQIDGEKWTILVGKLNGRPYEVFGGLAEHVQIPKRLTEGKIVKKKCQKINARGRMSCYDLVIGEGDDAWVIGDIVSTFNDGVYAHDTRMISQLLRSGNQIHHIADTLGRDEERPFFSFSKVMARVLRKYIKDGLEVGAKCSECGGTVIYEGGCHICRDCGHSSKCG